SLAPHAPRDLRDLGGGLLRVHGDAHELGAGPRELDDLRGRARGILGVGVRHRLDDDGRAAADDDATDAAGDAPVTRRCWHAVDGNYRGSRRFLARRKSGWSAQRARTARVTVETGRATVRSEARTRRRSSARSSAVA